METDYSLAKEQLKHKIDQVERIRLTKTVAKGVRGFVQHSLILDSFQKGETRDISKGDTVEER